MRGTASVPKPFVIKPDGYADSTKKQLYRDRRSSVIGTFSGEWRRREGHATRDRKFKPLITIAREYLFKPVEGASYYVPAPEFSRYFEAVES